MSALREVSNLANYNNDPKLRVRATNVVPPPTAGSFTFPSQEEHSLRARRSRSPRLDEQHASDPTYCADLIKDISEAYLENEKAAVRRFNEGTSQYNAAAASGALARAPAPSDIYAYYASPHYLQYQPEVNEKMRMILIDWLVDVHLKFKLHTETFFLCVNLIDRYLSVFNTKYGSTDGNNNNNFISRAKLQLVGVCAMLLASKYEEIWPPEIKDCVHISANTYSREEIIITERAICAALNFRLTVPTAFPFAARLWTVLEGAPGRTAVFGTAVASPMDGEALHTLIKHATCFYLEHSLLDYKCLQFTPSQVANAAVYLALATLRLHLAAHVGSPIWIDVLQHYSTVSLAEFSGCAELILEHVHYVPTTKYQAVRRKYNSSKFGEISKMQLPNQLPVY
ncbi:cyclin A [Angomonas deanei]|nr:cyclin A [Angomonas deanei]|eukprot:EPY32399.1 cyclin A [Angomonas deanei]